MFYISFMHVYCEHWSRNVSRWVAGINFKLSLSCTVIMSIIKQEEFKVDSWQSVNHTQHTLIRGSRACPSGKYLKIYSTEIESGSNFDGNLRSSKAHGVQLATSSTSPGSVPVLFSGYTQLWVQNFAPMEEKGLEVMFAYSNICKLCSEEN